MQIFQKDGESTESEDTHTHDSSTEEAEAATIDPDSITNSDVYLFENNVTIDYPINGNVFICADNVEISSQIGGDVFVCAKNITIKPEAYIYSSLFAVSDNITIYGIVSDLYAGAKTINISGAIYRDVKVGTSTFNLSGLIGRDAYISADELNITDLSDQNITALVGGDFNYTSTNEATIPEGAVTGNVNFSQKYIESDNSVSVNAMIVNLVKFLCTVAIIWLISLWFTSNSSKEKNILNTLSLRNLLGMLGLGLLTPIILLILFIVLLLLKFTTSLAILTLIALIVLFMLGASIFVININNLICSKMKIHNKFLVFVMLLLTSAIYWGIINSIPIMNLIVSIVGIFGGIGIITHNVFQMRSKSKIDTIISTDYSVENTNKSEDKLSDKHESSNTTDEKASNEVENTNKDVKSSDKVESTDKDDESPDNVENTNKDDELSDNIENTDKDDESSDKVENTDKDDESSDK